MPLRILLAAALIASPAFADVTFSEGDIFPESLSADARGRLYIGSVKGTVYRTAADGELAEPWITATPENGLLALLGVLADDRSGTLWVCTAPFPGSPHAEGVSALVAFALATGKLKARYELPPPASACNDIAIDRRGTVFITDTANGRIFTLKPGAKALTLFAEDKAQTGIDGIAFAADGTLYTNNVRAGTMQRVERKPDGSFATFTTLGLSRKLTGPDGLRPIGANKFLQAESGGPGGRISEVTIIGTNAAIETIWEGPHSTPGVTPSKRGVFATEGKIGYLFDPKLKGQDPNPFTVRAIPAREPK